MLRAYEFKQIISDPQGLCLHIDKRKENPVSFREAAKIVIFSGLVSGPTTKKNFLRLPFANSIFILWGINHIIKT